MWPHTVCYIQYQFWHHIHQFSKSFHVRGRTQFWNVPSIYHWWWQYFQKSFHNNEKVLKITYWVLSKRKHKVNSWEKYHNFINNNKKQTINYNNRGTHNVIIYNAKTSKYDWNVSPIDSTDIVRSAASVWICITYHGNRTKQYIKHFPYRIPPQCLYQF